VGSSVDHTAKYQELRKRRRRKKKKKEKKKKRVLCKLYLEYE
jgi:hypothetical protein